jgi:hypothetical protein
MTAMMAMPGGARGASFFPSHRAVVIGIRPVKHGQRSYRNFGKRQHAVAIRILALKPVSVPHCAVPALSASRARARAPAFVPRGGHRLKLRAIERTIAVCVRLGPSLVAPLDPLNTANMASMTPFRAISGQLFHFLGRNAGTHVAILSHHLFAGYCLACLVAPLVTAMMTARHRIALCRVDLPVAIDIHTLETAGQPLRSPDIGMGVRFCAADRSVPVGIRCSKTLSNAGFYLRSGNWLGIVSVTAALRKGRKGEY